VRPGLTADGGLLLPLQKGRSGEEAPIFVVELTYIQQGVGWTEKGESHVELPTGDLPVSRSVVVYHFSPRYAVDARSGSFRVTTDPGPWRDGIGAIVPTAAPVPAPPPAASEEKDLQALMDRYKKESGRSRQGAVPIAIDFPELGPSIVLAAELTAEAHAPSIDFAYRRTGGR